MNRPRAVRLVLALCPVVGLLPAPASAQGPETEHTLIVDASAPAHPLPHFWEQMFGSGRANLSLRESYRDDLRSVKQITDFGYVRFHGILMDENGVYSEDAQGQPVYDFSYADQIYDGLLKNGVRPFVELSFMPKQLAAREAIFSFWYKPSVSPPKDWAKWDDLIYRLTKHLVDRYGIDEVAQWYFEVWNEPNIDFWAGEPKQATYFELYDHTAADVKRVNQRLHVGGPATAQAAWVDAFIQHCVTNHIPVDFVSTHVYGNDSSQDVFGTQENIPRDQMVCRAVKKVHDQIKASSLPELPLIWSEFNASYKAEPDVTDALYMAPWLADTIRQCDGLVDVMSYWTFSDVFEEQGVVKRPFYGGFGLMAAGAIPKPSYNAFKLLHMLGDERIALDSDSALLTRRDDGTLVLALWNLFPPGQSGVAKTVTLQLKDSKAHRAYISRVDENHGDVLPAYEKMGSPAYPTTAQLQELRKSAELPLAEKQELKNGGLTIVLPPDGLAVIELRK